MFSGSNYNDGGRNKEPLTTEQKLKMSNFGGLSGQEKKNQIMSMSLKIILQSKMKLK
jgi:hypothetical protein